MTTQHKNTRREFIRNTMAGFVVLSVPTTKVFASPVADAPNNKKVVWVMLRGAMDSLHAIIPTFDPYYFGHRNNIISDIKNTLLPLEAGYALHPAFTHLHALYKKKQFSPVVAVASAYRERSHFDAQDQMESGLNETEHENGWLARAIEQYQGQSIAIARTVPIALRSNGQALPNTWYPSSFKPADEDLLARLETLYENDQELQQLLSQATQQRDNPNMMSERRSRPKFALLANRCGEILRGDENINCAMLELSGWDTHNNQPGRLQRQFGVLDDGIKALQTGLGDSWNDTLVIVSTEFGRTVALNGTGGTDHGTASCLFMLGGALKNGGKVLGEWPGLGPEKLFEARDLMPTSDVRSWISASLKQHWDLNSAQINAIFPDIVNKDIQLSWRRSMRTMS